MSMMHIDFHLICGVNLSRERWSKRVGGVDGDQNRVSEIWADFESQFTCQNDSDSELRVCTVLSTLLSDEDRYVMIDHTEIKRSPATHKGKWVKAVKLWHKSVPDCPQELHKVFQDLVKAATDRHWQYFLVEIREDG